MGILNGPYGDPERGRREYMTHSTNAITQCELKTPEKLRGKGLICSCMLQICSCWQFGTDKFGRICSVAERSVYTNTLYTCIVRGI